MATDGLLNDNREERKKKVYFNMKVFRWIDKSRDNAVCEYRFTDKGKFIGFFVDDVKKEIVSDGKPLNNQVIESLRQGGFILVRNK